MTMSLSRKPRLPTAAMSLELARHSYRQFLTKPRLIPPPTSACSAGPYVFHSWNHNQTPRSAITVKCFGLPSSPTPSSSSSSMMKPSVEQEEVDEQATAEESPSQLHIVCCWNDHADLATIVSNVLSRDFQSIRRRFRLVRTSSTKVDRTSLLCRDHQRQRYEPYTFPLNLALFHQPKSNPNLKLLRILAEAGPDVLCMEDGNVSGGAGSGAGGDFSLTIALRHHPKNLAIVQLLLAANPDCIQVTDKRGNTPLHVACFHHGGGGGSTSSPASLQVVQELYCHNPAALDEANMNGETPWMMVQRNSRLSSSPLADFLFACSARRERRRKAVVPSPTGIETTKSVLEQGDGE